MKFDYSPVAYAGQFWIQGRLVSGDNGFAGDVLSRELLLASMTAFMSKAFGAIVVMPIPPMPYIITMLEAGAIILTPLAQLLTETIDSIPVVEAKQRHNVCLQDIDSCLWVLNREVTSACGLQGKHLVLAISTHNLSLG